MAKNKEFSLNEAMEELKSILTKLESDSTDIDQIPLLVERAKHLHQQCEEKLTGIENNIIQN